MRPMTLIAAAGIVLATVAAPAIALAGEARASGDAPVREGPGSRYAVIDSLEDGEYYEVLDCTRRAIWCLVAEAGDEDDVLGWVRGSSLIGSGAKVTATPFEFLVTPEFLKKKP